jgi:hypothetical protein
MPVITRRRREEPPLALLRSSDGEALPGNMNGEGKGAEMQGNGSVDGSRTEHHHEALRFSSF